MCMEPYIEQMFSDNMVKVGDFYNIPGLRCYILSHHSILFNDQKNSISTISITITVTSTILLLDQLITFVLFKNVVTHDPCLY